MLRLPCNSFNLATRKTTGAILNRFFIDIVLIGKTCAAATLCCANAYNFNSARIQQAVAPPVSILAPHQRLAYKALIVVFLVAGATTKHALLAVAS